MKEYNKEVLKQLQDTEYEMLKDFHQICRDNNLSYFAIGGTLLGAIRHQAMIPWDDDVDLGLPRKDYNKLKKIIKRDWSDKYFIIDQQEDTAFPLMTGQFVKKGTRFVTEQFVGLPCPFGIYLDLFPMDNLSDDIKTRKSNMWRSWFWGKLRIVKAIPEPYVAGNGLVHQLIIKACRIGHRVLNFLPVDEKKLYKYCLYWSEKNNKEETEFIGFSCDTKPFDNMISREDLFPLLSVPFGSTEINIPQKYHELLESQYGDYMKLPPIEQRKNHCPAILEF